MTVGRPSEQRALASLEARKGRSIWAAAIALSTWRRLVPSRWPVSSLSRDKVLAGQKVRHHLPPRPTLGDDDCRFGGRHIV